ncbi:MAG: transglycosylase family protein, partial [Actinomycetota bacterium]|nr:transglycosylase family protein [Actinomycetota bacterium]
MISLIPKRTLAVCACALGASSGATTALAADDDKAARENRPVVGPLVPVVDEQLVPPSGRPTRRLQDRYLELHKTAHKSGEKPGRDVVRDGVKERDGDLRLASARDVKRSVGVLKRLSRPAAGGSTTSTGGSAPSGRLSAIAGCESGGDPGAVGGGGAYRGKYQFSRETWASVGGSGDPAAAPEA